MPTVSQNYQGGEITNPTNPTVPGFTNPTNSNESSSAWAGMDPALMKQFLQALQEAMGSGSADYQAQRAARNQVLQSTQALLPQYSKDAAFSDASAAMAQNLRQSMEKNMPAISKAVQGAGTSASSMQALLSSKLATDSAQAAGALGADQAVKYGTIQSNLSSVLDSLTKIDPTLANLTASLFSSARSQTQTSNKTSSGGGGTTASGGGGGGTQFAPPPWLGGSSSGSSSGGTNYGALGAGDFANLANTMTQQANWDPNAVTMTPSSGNTITTPSNDFYQPTTSYLDPIYDPNTYSSGSSDSYYYP